MIINPPQGDPSRVGNVGIGVVEPQTTLDVNGAIQANNSISAKILSTRGDTDIVEIGNNDYGARLLITDSIPTSPRWEIFNNQNTSLDFTLNQDQYISVDGATGNVNIINNITRDNIDINEANEKTIPNINWVKKHISDNNDDLWEVKNDNVQLKNDKNVKINNLDITGTTTTINGNVVMGNTTDSSYTFMLNGKNLDTHISDSHSGQYLPLTGTTEQSLMEGNIKFSGTNREISGVQRLDMSTISSIIQFTPEESSGGTNCIKSAADEDDKDCTNIIIEGDKPITKGGGGNLILKGGVANVVGSGEGDSDVEPQDGSVVLGLQGGLCMGMGAAQVGSEYDPIAVDTFQIQSTNNWYIKPKTCFCEIKIKREDGGGEYLPPVGEDYTAHSIIAIAPQFKPSIGSILYLTLGQLTNDTRQTSIIVKSTPTEMYVGGSLNNTFPTGSSPIKLAQSSRTLYNTPNSPSSNWNFGDGQSAGDGQGHPGGSLLVLMYLGSWSPYGVWKEISYIE
jgi:hypothetical protein